jgi:hypothetical protein
MKRANAEYYAVLAEFREAEELLHAVKETRKAGYVCFDAYSPFPLEGLSEAIGFTRDRIPLFTLIGGVLGGAIGYGMQWYANVIDYPINVGGRPLHSWPAFIPVTFELTVLGAALSAAFGMLWLNGLPETYHPIFNQKNFERASKDRFFLSIQSNDSKFDLDKTKDFLLSLEPETVCEVLHEG